MAIQVEFVVTGPDRLHCAGCEATRAGDSP